MDVDDAQARRHRTSPRAFRNDPDPVARGTERRRRWRLRAVIAALLLVAALAYIQPGHLSNAATVGSVGLGYFIDHPSLLIHTDRIKARLQDLGLREVAASAWRTAIQAGPNYNDGDSGPFDPSAPVEDAVARAALPAQTVIPGLTSSPGWTAKSLPLDLRQFESWTRSHGDIYSSKFAAVDQINVMNAGELELAWSVDTRLIGGANGDRWQAVEANPIYADGLLYVVTADSTVMALHADTGAPAWAFKAPDQVARRGLIYWPGEGEHTPRIYAAVGTEIVALDARTGLRVDTFGDLGFAATGESRVAPLIHGRALIVAAMFTSELIGLDLITGERLWTIAAHPEGHNFYNGNMWAGLSLDPDRNLVFTSTGNAYPTVFGAARPGDNANASSVIAFDVAAGKIAWTFQEVRHDLWDFDIPSPPALTTIEIDGRPVDVVVAVTKIGHVLILERETGRPVFDVPLVRAPTSKVPGEQTAPYQPSLSTPEPLIGLVFSPDHITRVEPEATESVAFQIENAHFGWFQPPVLGETIVTFGLHGGAEWPGVAIDHFRGIAYVPVNHIPWKIRLFLAPLDDSVRLSGPHDDLYRRACESCHGTNRLGNYDTEGEADVNFVPSLAGISYRESAPRFFVQSYFRHRHQHAAPDLAPSQAELDELQRLFGDWDAEIERSGGFRVLYQWSQLLDHEGRPGSNPPWGSLIAVELATGRQLWSKPIGQARIGGEMVEVGTPNYGGVITTTGGVVFATGTVDGYVRAFDAATGELLWAYKMDAAGSAPPTTYVKDGVQYVSVFASGGQYHNYDARSSRVYTFRLPREKN